MYIIVRNMYTIVRNMYTIVRNMYTIVRNMYTIVRNMYTIVRNVPLTSTSAICCFLGCLKLNLCFQGLASGRSASPTASGSLQANYSHLFSARIYTGTLLYGSLEQQLEYLQAAVNKDKKTIIKKLKGERGALSHNMTFEHLFIVQNGVHRDEFV
jgi:hypothetical protein